MTNFNWETAREMLADHLYMSKTGDSRPAIHCDENRVVAAISGRPYWAGGKEVRREYLVYERTFLASCSSSWSWGLERFPAYPWEGEVLHLCGQSDILEEAGFDTILEGIRRAKLRDSREKHALPAIQCYVVTLDFPGMFEDNLKVTPDTMVSFSLTQKVIKSFNQPGYAAVCPIGTTVIILAEEGTYMQYLRDRLVKYLSKGYAVDKYPTPSKDVVCAISYGDVYYGLDRRLIGEPINRNWYHLQNAYPGTIRIDAPSLVRHNCMDFLEYWGVDKADPKSIKSNVEDLEFFEVNPEELALQHDWI